MTQFQNTSLHNIPGVTQIRTQPGSIFINPAGVHLEKQRQAAAVQPEARTRPYAYVASLGLGATRIFRNCDVVEGRQRGAHAELVVVPDLAFLHDEERLAGDAESTVTLLYIVALGRDVATQAQLTRASGVPNRLCPEQVVRHHARAFETPKTFFCLGPELDEAVKTAMKNITEKPESNYKIDVTEKKIKKKKIEAIHFVDLRSVVSWACSVRRARTVIGPKTFFADGRRMST